MRKSWVFLVFGFLFISSAFALVVISRSSGHNGSDIAISLNGGNTRLQTALDQGKFNSAYTGGASTENLVYGHNGSEVYVNIGGTTESLATALSDGKLENTIPGVSPASYSTVVFGETANNIFVTLKGTEKTLQKAINDGDFIVTAWSIGDWSACSVSGCGQTGTQTRPVVCKTPNGAIVLDSYCALTKPEPTQACSTGSCGGGGSCPYVYSKTSQGEMMEEDIALNQYSKYMEVPSFTRLESFDSSVGQIVVREQLEEVSYINNLKLIKVSHDSDSEAFISGTGSIVTVSSPQAVICVDKSGKDCTSLVAKKDASYVAPRSEVPQSKVISQESFGKTAYSTNVKNVNLESEGTYTDYIDLTLPETSSKEGKLILSYSSTIAGATFDGFLFDSLRNILPYVYSLVEKNKAFSDLVFDKDVYEDSARILVQDKDGNWVPYGSDANSMINTEPEKDTVIVLDIDKVLNGKVRIEFISAGFAFDYAAVDYSKDKILSQVEVKPTSAIFSGEDITNVISNSDDKYVTLKNGDSIVASFDTANDEKGTTYFLESGAYYQPLGDGSGNLDLAQLSLFYKIIFEKNFADKYFLEYVIDSYKNN